MKKTLPLFLKILLILTAVLLGWNARQQAAQTLPVDYDEDDYIRAAQEYTSVFRSGNLINLTEYNYRPEHPPLAKIIFGASLLSAPEKPLTPDRETTASPDSYLSRDLLLPARTVSAIQGSLTVFLLALINPLAGVLLASHTFTIKYTSQVMLEALPSLTSFLTILAYLGYKNTTRKYWLILSALFLGLTAASKYMYCLVGIAILIDWVLDARKNNLLKKSLLYAFGWGLLSIIFFFAANPYLWFDSLTRLQESIFFHAAYSTTASEVQSAGFPIWQPFIWLSMSPKEWHPMVFRFAPDIYISIFAVLGLPRLWKKERLYVLWLIVAILFLLAWPTKWPQYILVLTVPLSLAAAEGLFTVFVQPLQHWWKNRSIKHPSTLNPPKNEINRAAKWLIPGLIAFTLLTIFPLIFQFAVSLTDFSAASIRDGFTGGIWREVFGGLSGQIKPTSFELVTRSNYVRFVGLSSFEPIFNYVASQGILFFNIMWMILSVLLQTLLGLVCALLLWQKNLRLGKFWQAIFILPWAIPEMIGAYLWLNIFQPANGWLALAVTQYGPNIPFGFLNGWQDTTNLWLLIYLIAALWYGFPFMMLAASAGLKMISPDVLEAAKIDGANRWQSFRFIIWPLLQPLLLPAIIIRSIFSFNQFYLFQVFFFPNSTLATFSYNVFNPSGFNRNGGSFALSAVINLIAVVILAGLVTVFNRYSQVGKGASNV